MCIGLKHKHLFRNPFYSPSVEATLKLLLHPKKNRRFTVKMMRLDTVGGLLVTALSRTYPPLIPPHISEQFQNPNGRFFFELLGLLPEINRFLFVEIMDLCCDLADNQIYNHISHSKLAVYPGSCCFGLDEYMPTWDTRYLFTSDKKKVSSLFYHIIMAYREERDLSAEELQQKLDTRNRILEQERLEVLEKEHGLESALAIMRMEARIAQGLPAESPEIVSVQLSASTSSMDDMKEVCLYGDRQEKIVADDAISVLDIQLDDGTNDVAVVPNLDTVAEEKEDEDIEKVLADLRRSVSVASLGYAAENRQLRSTLSLSATTTMTTLTASSSTSTISSSATAAPSTTISSYKKSSAPAATSISRPNELLRAKSAARFGSIAQNLFPVSPGDIFGISRHAIEQRELQEFLSVARTTKKRRKPIASKRITQWRLQNKLLRRRSSVSSSSSDSASSQFCGSTNRPVCMIQRYRSHHQLSYRRPISGNHLNSISLQQLKARLITTPSLRRGRTRQFRKELEVYQARGLSVEEATKEYEQDIKKQRRREKRAKKAYAAAKKQAEIEAEAARAIAKNDGDVTMEEAEILEAFDYLTDQEFEEFMKLADLTMQDVERIREKAAAAALNQVTKDIQSAPSTSAVPVETVVITGPETSETKSSSSPISITTASASFAEGEEKPKAMTSDSLELSAVQGRKSRPTSLPHMTSMDLLFKNATVIGDSNLRCYPTRPSSPTDIVSGNGSVTPPASEKIVEFETVYEEHIIDDEDDDTELFEELRSEDDDDGESDYEEALEELPLESYVDDGNEDDMELQDLLDAMTEEERLEFVRLSRHDVLPIQLVPATVAGTV
ncbi:hypothetical protein BGZ51_000170 [Haplosporangium sp. Z 767]|nr:hypothetical protein BGZ51_000170 [Haplosporangium sp. Z 767]KAF9191213.1 hypothetical protein BGZ50_009559 [Haplosporangium sp. Z 11]